MPGLQRITAASETQLLHGSEATRTIEVELQRSLAAHTLMQRAGESVARLALAVAPHARMVHVVCGPGNNGGDGLVAATLLHRAGHRVRVTHLAEAAGLPDDAAWALTQAQAAGVAMSSDLGGFDHTDIELTLDALLGLGMRRAPTGTLATAIERINAAGPVLAVDLPSGLGADTGQPAGAVVRAHHTLSLLTLKPGLFTGQGRDLAGQVWLDTLDADLPAATASAQLTAARCHRAAWPARAHRSHKGHFGDLVVVGGAPGMVGAAWLAASAALTAGAGRVYCSLLDTNADLFMPARPELMGRTSGWHSAPEVLAGSTVVCGCGGGVAVRDVLPALLGRVRRLVLDADALNAVAADTQLQDLLRSRADRGHVTVLTPHPLEAARLLGSSAAEVQNDRLDHATRLAKKFGCVVVLKGSGTVVAASGTLPSINLSGNGLLATAGTGDVLAGWIGGTWTAGADGGGVPAARRAAEASVWLHGAAADQHLQRHGGQLPLRAADLIDAMRSLLTT